MKKRLDALENQMLNEVPMAIPSSTAHIVQRTGAIEASINAIVSEVANRPHVPQQHNVATPAEPDLLGDGHDPWARCPTQQQQQRQKPEHHEPMNRNLRTEFAEAGQPIESYPFEHGPAPNMPATFNGNAEAEGSPFQEGPPMEQTPFEAPFFPPPHARTMRSPIFGHGGPS